MTLVTQLRAFLENALFSMHITSASPGFVNVLRDVDINPTDFDQVIRDEVERIIDERMAEVSEEEDELSLGEIPEKKSGSAGLSESGVASNIGTGVNLLKNPASGIGMLLRFIPHVALITLALKLIPIIIGELKRPGSLLDIRFKRIMQNEFNSFLDRQEQMNTQLGYRQVIIQSKAGFTMQAGGGGTYNNLVDKRMGGLDPERQAVVGLVNHATELFGPLG